MGVRFIAINDSYDSLDKNQSDSLIIPFKNLINDAYCKDISVKIRSQLEIKRKKGQFIGAFAVYGYLKDEEDYNKLVIDGGLDIITAKHGKSTCRNEAIAEAFHYMKIVEAWGTGIPRIISRCKEYGLLEPVFEELGDGFKVTLFRKISNEAEKISNAREKVSNTFDGYISLLKEVETTDIFINNIRMVYEHCNANTPFGQANDDTDYTIYIVSPQPQQALTGSYPARAVKSLHSLRHDVLISGAAENAHNQPVPSG